MNLETQKHTKRIKIHQSQSHTINFFSCGLTKAFDHSTCLGTCLCQETGLITMLETAGNNSSIHSLTISVGIGLLLQELAGCNKNHTACHSGWLKLAFTCPDVISSSPKSFLMSRIVDGYFHWIMSMKLVRYPLLACSI